MIMQYEYRFIVGNIFDIFTYSIRFFNPELEIPLTYFSVRYPFTHLSWPPNQSTPFSKSELRV